MCVAIVDDEAGIRVGLRRLCEALDLSVDSYASGVEFLDDLWAERTNPDCLLLDAHMPEMTGLEVQHQLVARGVRFPTVVYSADDEPEALDRYIAAGAVAYLRKPIRGRELLDAIERARAAPPA